VGGGSHDVVHGTMLAFAWRDRRKLCRILASTVGVSRRRGSVVGIATGYRLDNQRV
jgi:hypothetical protein